MKVSNRYLGILLKIWLNYFVNLKIYVVYSVSQGQGDWKERSVNRPRREWGLSEPPQTTPWSDQKQKFMNKQKTL